jgi:hypothetical protein
MTQSAPPPATTRTRLLHVDNLRVALTALVVVHHAAIAYSHIPLWYYAEPATDPSATLLDILLALDQSFFMGAFFLIAGLFVPGSYDRKGAGRFLRDRLVRLGVPLLLFAVVLRPLVSAGIYPLWRDEVVQQGVEPSYWLFYVQTWSPGPMWFVEVLLVLSAVYVLWRRVAGARPAPEPTPLGAAAIVGFTAGLAVATYLWRTVVPVGSSVPVLGLPTPAYLPQYVALFAVGVLAARRGWLAGLSRTAGRAAFTAAAVAVVAYLLVLASSGEAFLGHGTWQSLAAATCEAVIAVGMIVGLLVLFGGRLDEQGPRRRFLSDHAYAVYLTHPVVLVALGYAFSGVQAPAVVKFVLLAVPALPLCWGLAYLVRCLPGARKVL